MCLYGCPRKIGTIGEIFEALGVQYHAFERTARWQDGLTQKFELDYVEALHRADRKDCPPRDKDVAYQVVTWDQAAWPEKGLFNMVANIQHDSACGCESCARRINDMIRDYRARVAAGESQIVSTGADLGVCTPLGVVLQRRRAAKK